MRYIGDIHGDRHLYTKAIEGCDESIQVGDYGIGFITLSDLALWPTVIGDTNTRHTFIRGNHDNPSVCDNLPTFIGAGKDERHPDHFFVGGGYSLDKDYRTPGLDWWPEEQYDQYRMMILLQQYERMKPRIMVTHEAPSGVVDRMFTSEMNKVKFPPSQTSAFLQLFLEAHRPEHWIFGHWHKTAVLVDQGTMFQCLGIGEWIEL